MTNLLFVISTLNPGGAEIQLLRTLQNLNYTKYKVTLLILSNNQKLLSQVPSNVNSVTFNFRKTGFYSLIDLIKLLKLILKISPEIIHSSLLLSNLIVRPIKIFKKNIKIINHIHGQGNWVPKIIRLIDTKTAFLVDTFLFVSEFSAALRIKREKYPVGKVMVLHNAVNVKDLVLLTARKEIRSINIGTLSRLTSVKQLDKAIDVIVYLNKNGLDSKLIIAGNGEEQERLAAYCKNKSADGVVEFVGFQSNIPRFLASIDVLLSTSLREDLPINLIEGLIAGKVLVATNVGGVSEIIEDRVEGLLVSPELTEQDFIDIIAYLNKVNFAKAELTNKNIGIEKFDMDNYMASLDCLYNE